MTVHSEMVADAELFNALHRAIRESLAPEPSTDDRRRGSRQAYECVQLLAPYNGKLLPLQADYSLVLCHDLSPHGFSYVCDKPPLTQQLVAALERTPFQFFLVEVVNRRPIKRQGKSKILVGCRFLRRIGQ